MTHDRGPKADPPGIPKEHPEARRPPQPSRDMHRCRRTAPRARAPRQRQPRRGRTFEGVVPVTLRVNGKHRQLRVDPRTTLLDGLRETLSLTGTKKGCDHGRCGACTVHVDGRHVLSCLSLALVHDGKDITTIEGLGTPEALHPMQAAFLATTPISAAIARAARSCRPWR